MQPQDFKSKLTYSKEYRLKQDLRRYINQTFVESNSYWSIDVKNNRLIKSKPTGVSRKVNLARPIIRNLINSITRNDPRWYPEKGRLKGRATKDDRKIANILLNTVWKEGNCQPKLKDLIRTSCIKSIGYWEVFYDESNEDSLGISIENLDAFDVYIDPHGKMKGGRLKARRVIKACGIAVTDIQEEEGYNENKYLINVESRMAESDRKEQIMQSNKGGQPDEKSLGTAILYELYFRKKGDSGKQTVHKQVFCQDHALTDEVDLNLNELPIIPYQMERMEGVLYPTEWTDPVVEMNKSVNRIASSIEEYVHTIAKGRYLKRRGERISTVQSQHGQFIEYDNVMPQAMQVAPMGEIPFAMMSNFERWAGDTGGSHAMSSGRSQAVKTRSSKGLELMQNMDLESVSEPVDNLKIFLSNVGEMILDIASKQFDSIKKIYIEDDEYSVVGEGAGGGIKGEYSNNTYKIKPFKGIYVNIMPGSLFNDLQKKQDLITLRQAGIPIPDKYIIEAFQIGNTDEVLSEMLAEQEKNKNPDIDLAEAENKKMIRGQPVHADIEEDHRIHKSIHAKLLEGVKDQDPELSKMIITHIREHEAIEKGGQESPPQLESDENRSPAQPLPL